jgi:hypothetical protein
MPFYQRVHRNLKSFGLWYILDIGYHGSDCFKEIGEKAAGLARSGCKTHETLDAFNILE